MICRMEFAAQKRRQMGITPRNNFRIGKQDLVTAGDFDGSAVTHQGGHAPPGLLGE